MDSARWHWAKSTLECVESLNIHPVRIPRGLTGILQPAEVSWFGEIERSYHRKWMPWFLDDGKYLTDINCGSYIRTIAWLSDIWSSFPETKIAKSFEQCGITSEENRFFADPELIILN